MLTSNEVRVAEFSTVRVAAGYEMVEVDDLLDRLADSLADHERGSSGDQLTADEVAAAQFTQTRIREGYRPDEVDELLDRAVETLRGYENAAASGAIPATGDALAGPPPVTTADNTGKIQPAEPFAQQAGPEPFAQQPGPEAFAQPGAEPFAQPGPEAFAQQPGVDPFAQQPAAPAGAGPPAGALIRPNARSSYAAPPGDQGLTVDDVVQRLQSLQAHQEAGLVNAPVQVRTPDGRTFTVAAVKSSTTGLVLTVSR